MNKQNRMNFIMGEKPLEVPNISFGQYTLNRLRGNPLRIVQVDGQTGEVLTNRDILARSVKLATVLCDRGVKVGDTIAISAENHINWLIAACATLYTGAILAPLNPSYAKGEVIHSLNIAKPKIIFVSRRSEASISEAIETLRLPIEMVQLDNLPLSNGVLSLKTILSKSRQWPDPYNYNAVYIDRPDKQALVILYSSGTTGLPKGVMLSHRNMLLQELAITQPNFMNYNQNDVILMMPPFFHGYGFAMMMSAIHIGFMAITMTEYQPDIYLDIIGKYRVNIITVVPPMMNFFAKNPIVSRYDYSSLKTVICAAAPLLPEMRRDALRRLGNPILRIAYGMTELSVVISLSRRDMRKPESVGFLVAGMSCKVIDPETSESLTQGQIGEMCFKGGHVMLGYRDNPEATRQTIDPDGWLHTGDLGYYDEDGDLFIVDRLKELIKYKGFQVSPSEIESLLLSHPEITDAAVIGKPDLNAGELPMALVVKDAGSKITANEIQNFVNGIFARVSSTERAMEELRPEGTTLIITETSAPERVSPQSKLRGGVNFVKTIPKNSSGKILRKELRKLVSKL